MCFLSEAHIALDNRSTQIRFLIATDKRGYPHIIFLISPQNIGCGYSLEAPHRGTSNEYPQHMFSWRNKKDISIFRMKKAPYLLLCFLFHHEHVSWLLIAPDKRGHQINNFLISP